MSKAELLTVSNEEYHALRDSWSHSQIEVLIDSPELFRGRFLSEQPEYPRKMSKDLDWGTVADAALTNPKGMDDVMRIIPLHYLNADGHRKGDAWKAFEAMHAGLILMKESECTEIVRAVRNCRAHPVAKRVLEAPGDFQLTIRHLDDETGLWLRTRLDKISYLPEGLTAADIKTTRNQKPRQFAADAYKFGYHRQAGWYWDALVELGLEPDAWLNIAIGKPDPQETAVYEMEPEAISLGRQENRKYLRELAERIYKKDWRPRDLYQVQRLDMPRFAYFNQYEEENGD